KLAQVRSYQQAEKMLIEAVREAKQGGGNDRQLYMARCVLAEVYLGLENYEQADHLYNSGLSSAKKIFGPESIQSSQSLTGLAQIDLLRGRYGKAEVLIKNALSIEDKLHASAHDRGRSLLVLARVLHKEGFSEEAEPAFAQALKLIEEEP